ncbi:MAG TPA: GGDEF domain-containing protein [Hyphomicrobiales bacterium]|nr:GGDEF domain-containing protein [Hyphomicrobiales bacterium]
MAVADEFERTIGFGEAALDRMRRLRHAAYPRNYEVWYTYMTGYNAGLNQAINEILDNGGLLGDEDLDRLYDQHLSPARFARRFDEVGSHIQDEIDRIVALIDSARDRADSYGTTLGRILESLGANEHRQQLLDIVTTLVRATEETKRANADLEERLAASRAQLVVLQDDIEAVRNESLTDPLTQLANRKCFDNTMAKVLAEVAEDGQLFSLLLADIDHFKAFNDSYGHLVGDQVLRLVASSLKQSVKGRDLAARYGGEEFAIILKATGSSDAVTVAEDIRRAVMSRQLVKRSSGESLGRVTLSIGVATWHEGDGIKDLIERADTCLYAAKRGGRNRVVSEDNLTVQKLAALVIG